MKTIKAARIHNYGGAETIRVEDATLAGPQPGQLIVRVHAAGVNPIDWKIRAGYMQQMLPLQFPVTLGGDFSGVVEAAGPDAGFKAGDEVYGQASLANGGSGSFAESVLARAGTVAAKPKSVSHVEAGALPLRVSARFRLLPNICAFRAHKKSSFTAAQAVSAALQSSSP